MSYYQAVDVYRLQNNIDICSIDFKQLFTIKNYSHEEHR
jgi:hypothetical protein